MGSTVRILRGVVLTALMFGAGCASSGQQVKIVDADKPASLRELFSKGETPQVKYQKTEIEEVPNKLKNPAKLSLIYAKLMEESQKYSAAKEHYNKVLQHEPKNIEAIVGLARAQLRLGMTEEAEDGFRHALRVAPDSHIALHGIGQFYAETGRWDEAVEMLNKATLAKPDDSKVRYELAVALVHTGDVEAALPHFIRTVGDAEAHYNVGLILKDMGRLEESRQQLRLALAKKPTLQQAQYWLDAMQKEQEPDRLTSYAPTTATRTVPFTGPATSRSLKPVTHADRLAMTHPLNR